MKDGRRVYVIGVGMTMFERCERDVRELTQEATNQALKDARVDFDAIEQAFCGYVTGMSTLGQQCI